MNGEAVGKSPGLRLGARVRMSPLGRERHPGCGDGEGTIVGSGSPSSWRVKFDDRKTIQAIHKDYLQAAPKQSVSERYPASPAVSRRNPPAR